MELSQLQTTLDELGRAFVEFKRINDERIKQIETVGVAQTDLVEKQQRIESAITDFEEIRDRVSVIEAKKDLPQFAPDERAIPQALYDHEDAFDDWLRAPRDPQAITALKAAQKSAGEAIIQLPRRMQRKYGQKAWLELGEISEPDREKAITITTTGGGNAIPTLVHDRIVEKIYDLSLMRQIANVTMASNENHRFIVLDNNATGGWAAAGGARSETTTPLLQSVTLTYGTAYAYPQVWEEAMDDLAMDVGALVERVTTRVIAQQEGVAFITGNGTARPTGFLNGSAVSPQTIVTTGDEASPQRAFGSLQYFATGAAAGFQADYFGGADSPEQEPQAVFYSTVYGLKAEYRANATWVSNKATLGVVRRLRDSDGRNLWEPSLQAGEPSLFVGYPVREMEAMPDIGANTFPMALGDFNEGYQIGDIVNTLRITVDDNITAPGFVKFYIRRRTGGNVLNDDAIKVVKCAAA